MKRDFLKALQLSDEQIDSIMQENGKDIESTKAKFADYEDLKNQLKSANETMEKFKDYDATKADVEKYKAELEKAQKESAAKIAKMERQTKIKEYTSSKKFINDFTRDSINALFEAELEKEESKGKSFDDIFGAITNGKENIFIDDSKPQPPKTISMKDDSNGKSALNDINKARSVMGLNPEK